LSEELALLPSDWPLIAVGGEAFKALAYLYPHRSVVGVPHPTGARGHFARLFINGMLRESVLVKVNQCINALSPELVWLEAHHESS
jgi:hypothetical protein